MAFFHTPKPLRRNKFFWKTFRKPFDCAARLCFFLETSWPICLSWTKWKPEYYMFVSVSFHSIILEDIATESTETKSFHFNFLKVWFNMRSVLPIFRKHFSVYSSRKFIPLTSNLVLKIFIKNWEKETS